MLGGAVRRAGGTSANKVLVHHTEEVVALANGVIPMPKDHLTGVEYTSITASETHPIRFINYGQNSNSGTSSAGARTQLTSGTFDGTKVLNFKNPAILGASTKPAEAGDHVRIFWVEEVTQDDAAIEVVISPSTFPGTYKVVGDTFMRSEKTGVDEAFQFIIEKAKVNSEVTITLEAEGDPSTFSMTLTVLRATGANGNEMMRLVRYGGTSSDSSADDDIGSLSVASE